MNIRVKVISLLALLFAALIGIEIGVQRQILMPSFAELEREDAKVSMKRIEFALDQSLDTLALTAADWGNWEDAYRYVQAPNDQFVRTNITPVALKQLQVNALMIVDLQGNVVLSSAKDLATGQTLDLDFAGRKSLPADLPWRRNLADGESARGLVSTNQGIMLIASAPVLNGSGSGTPLGSVIMGKLLTAHEVQMLGARAQAALSVLQGPGSTGEGAAERVSETSDLTRVDRSFSDIYGKPVLALRVEVPRRITAQGRNAVAYATACLVGAAVLALLALLVVLNRVVLEPLARVTSHAVAIGEGSDLERAAESPQPRRDRPSRARIRRHGRARGAIPAPARRSIFPCGLRRAREGRAAQPGQCDDTAGRSRGEAGRPAAHGAGG